jgi:type IV pilus assembly protein PilW
VTMILSSLSHCSPRRVGSRQAGLTLVELLVSMVIGLVLIGALVGVYTSSSGSVGAAKAQSQMTEDGQYVLRLLTQQIRLAGFNPIQPGRTAVNALPQGALNMAIFGCDTGFSNGTVAANATQLTCNGSATAGGGAIAVTYEADVYNTVPTTDSPPKPTDCLGTGLVQKNQTDPDGTGPYYYYVAENRFYVKNSTLYCAGSGSAAPFSEQPLADNVERIEFSFGASHPTSASKTVAGFLSSADIGANTGVPANADMQALPNGAERWAKVVAVRVCVIMRSATKVAEGSTSYFGCHPDSDATPLTSADGYQRKAYLTTVSLRNRMALP